MRGLITGLACAVAIASLWLADSSLFGLEWLLHDAMVRQLARERTVDPRIVVVAVNEASITALAESQGRPQEWSREVYARAIEELHRGGARVVALDILFREQALGHEEGDRRFAAALQLMPVILGAQTEAPRVQDAASSGTVFERALWRVSGRGGARYSALFPSDLYAAAAGVGTMRLATVERSANTRDYTLVDRIDDAKSSIRTAVPSLALETVRAFEQLPREAVLHDRTFTAGALRVPVNEAGNFSIRWNRDPHSGESEVTYPTVDFVKLYAASLAQDQPGLYPAAELAAFERTFRGKIVVIGFTGVGLDLRATPLSPRSAGVTIHANAIDNLLHRDFLRQANRVTMLALLLIITAAFGLMLDRTRSQWIAAAIALAIIGGWFAAGWLALRAAMTIPAASGAAASALAYLALSILSYASEQRQSAQLRATFGRYVSPQILEYLIAHPEKVRLGGERRDLTILFSDIRGFTTISEAAQPEEVVEMLNEYLTRMVEILLGYGGTLDKFIGDAVMGFWNAPASEPDHARKAVECAIDMIEATARLRERWEQEGKPSLRIGIGINSGDAVAGNIGAEQVFGYTVIGDAVNLASRLEGKNKDYGTEIIVSEFTLARMGDGFETVYLDDVKVKGKANAVRIYEVKGRKNV